jgi:hypothetical protein
LTGDEASELPAKSLAALHAGIGLAFANRVLEPIKSPCASDDIRHALRRFITLCQENSRPCYVGATYEALGLVARNLYPQLVQPIDQQLTRIREDLPSYFWHGVGRALYFAPTNFLPHSQSASQVVEMTQQEPPHELGRRNALAGLIWAMTLVNIKQPEILESFLKQHGARLPDVEAFSNGIGSALIIWRDSTEDDPFLKQFCQHRTNISDPRLSDLWTNLVRRPAEDALRRVYPALKQAESIGEVFRYRSLAGLVERLEREKQAGATRTGEATQIR